MEPTVIKYKIIFPYDFEDYALEIESKGWFNNVIVEVGEDKYCLEFYDFTRLSQDILEELSSSSMFVGNNIIVLESVTREAMQSAVDFIAKSGRFDRLNKFSSESNQDK